MGGWFAPTIATVSRGKGDAPATAKAAYRSGELILDERTGTTHDYRARSGVLWTGMAAPAGSPDWTADRSGLWNAAETKENRKNSVTARELMAPLPAEITPAERQRITQEVMDFLVIRYGVAVDAAIHAPNAAGDERNHHAHILFTTRSVGPDGWGDKTRALDESVKKDADGQSIGGKEIEAIREELAAITNRALERCGHAGDVDHRSYERRGIEREAEPHMGPVATQMERRGESSDQGDERRDVQARNAERQALKQEAEIIDLALARQARAEQADQPAKQQDGQRVERERSRFEQWANTRRAEAQSARIGVEVDQGRTHQLETLALDERQARDRPARMEQEAALAAITQKQQRTGLAGFLYRITGQARKDEGRATAIKNTLRDQAQRAAEERQALQGRHAAERAQTAQQHARQDRQLEQRIDLARDKREREGWQDQRRTRPGQQQEETTRERDAEAENSPVEGVQGLEGDSSTPATPEATHGQELGQSDPAIINTAWTAEEEAAKIAAEQARMNARRSSQERATGGGRTRSR